MYRILLVEDDVSIGSTLQSAMSANGYYCRWEVTAAEGLGAVRDVRPDLVILDLGLPDMDGFAACRELRGSSPESIIVVLTARRDSLDVVSGLESGADDYQTKPFRMLELQARVRAHLRRVEERSALVSAKILRSGSLVLDAGSRRLTVAGVEVQLRAREFDLLMRLLREPGRMVSRETLMADVWDTNWFGSTKTLDVHMASLRQRLAGASPGGTDVPVIRTIRGYGYRLDDPEPVAGSAG